MSAMRVLVCSSIGRRLSRGQSRGMPAVAVAAALVLLGSAAGAAQPAGRVAEFKRSADAAAAEARELASRQAGVVSESLVMNTVRQYAKKQELDGYLEQRSAQARAWETKLAAGEARRTRVRNPYTRATYDKYYDDKGDWQLSIIENDYRAAEKIQADWNAYHRRARNTLDGLRQEYAALVADVGLTAAQQTEMAGVVASAADRMGQFGTPPPELLPRPVEGDANSPFPTYKAFDAMTGQLIEIGSTGRRRPVEGEPTAGSRPTEPPPATNPPAGGGPALAGRTWNVTWPLTGARRYPLAISLKAGGKATAYYGTKNQFHSPSYHEGTWREQGGVVTVVLGSSGRPGYSSYTEGFTVIGRRGAGGMLEATDVRSP